MPLPELTLRDFNKIASGEYNAVDIEVISDNAEKLAMLQNNPDCEIEFNTDYKA